MPRFLAALFVAVVISSAQETPPEKKEDPKPKWDVSNPPGPRAKIDLNTDSGTWMNLDVSPKGDEIVFDLLGDIYTIPITGGTAKNLTEALLGTCSHAIVPTARASHLPAIARRRQHLDHESRWIEAGAGDQGRLSSSK